jgi:hypothetical protein
MNRSIPVWLCVLLMLIAVGSGFTLAQTPPQTPPQPQEPSAEPRILSGTDIGFRVEGLDRSGTLTGTLVVRVNGKWVPAVSAVGVRQLK